MGNCVRRLTGGGSEETTMSGGGASATPAVTSNSHTALEERLHTTLEECLHTVLEETSNSHTVLDECLHTALEECLHTAVEECLHTALEERLPSGHDVALAGCSVAGSSMKQKSEYFSPRVAEMMRSKGQFSSDVEHEIAHSRVHWSEVTGISKVSEDDDEEDEDDDHEDEEVTRENREVFAELMNDPQWEHETKGHFFFIWRPDWKLGQKIAKGGQAGIFEVVDNDGNIFSDRLVKVFRRGSRLSDLRTQWPSGVLQREVLTCVAFRGSVLDDGRFALLLFRCLGDLRKLIDQAMQEKNNQAPPFPYEWKGDTLHARTIMMHIAMHMDYLHKSNIIHRDLKAANILLHADAENICPIIADFECSIGVVGTGFWRAPEILLALMNGSPTEFSEKVDVYSFGMTCFEVVTGRLPFEGELEDCRKSRELVIVGRRPKLPSDLDVPWKDLIERCWNPIPSERPSFLEILQALIFVSIDGVPL